MLTAVMLSDRSDGLPLWLFMSEHKPSIVVVVEHAQVFLATATQDVHLGTLPSKALLPMIETWNEKLDINILHTLGYSQF